MLEESLSSINTQEKPGRIAKIRFADRAFIKKTTTAAVTLRLCGEEALEIAKRGRKDHIFSSEHFSEAPLPISSRNTSFSQIKEYFFSHL